MWDRLRKQAAVELEQLRRLIETHRPLVERSATSPPDPIQLSALAALLHAFYGGIENVLKRIATEVDGRTPGGESWHRELLEAMTVSTGRRAAVISEGLGDSLSEYLQFRHFFRHAYTFELRWDKMRSLVLGCEATLVKLEGELNKFLRQGGKTPAGVAGE